MDYLLVQYKIACAEHEVCLERVAQMVDHMNALAEAGASSVNFNHALEDHRYLTHHLDELGIRVAAIARLVERAGKE